MVFIYKGPTGCGKTYQAFYHTHGKTIYVAPCRQLVYESAQKYGTSRSQVQTGDIKMGERNFDISFRTYECCSRDDLRQVGTLIVDEAHFITDHQRGSRLEDLVYFMSEILHRKVILLSATMCFTYKGARIVELPARGKQFVKEEVYFDAFYRRVHEGVPTLWFQNSREDCYSRVDDLRSEGVKCAAITAWTSVADRVTIVNNYNKGIISCIVATNAMAQGVNIPCENLYLSYNARYDDIQLIVQKFGRLGRTGVTREDVVLTYCLGYGLHRSDIARAQQYFNTTSFEWTLKRGTQSLPSNEDKTTPSTQRELAMLDHKIQNSWNRYH